MATSESGPTWAVEVSGLFKIFGRDPLAALALRRRGADKQELLDVHGHVLALDGVDLRVAPGRIKVVMGLSGSGKSTLIRHVNRLIEPTAGRVTVDGEDVTTLSDERLRELRRHRVSMVFQRFALMPHRTVAENVAYGLRVQGVEPSEAARRAASWIERVGLAGYRQRYPAELSGGMQQRVGLARALATEARILLMDEPFGALDPLIRREMQDLLLSLQAELRRTVLFITHDLDEALRLGDSVAIMRDGRILQDADPQAIVLHPVDSHVAAFLNDINRGRVLRLGAVMTAPLDDIPGPDLAEDLVLEEAARRMLAHNAEAARVIDDAGNVVGSVTAAVLLAATVRPQPDAAPAEIAVGGGGPLWRLFRRPRRGGLPRSTGGASPGDSRDSR